MKFLAPVPLCLIARLAGRSPAPPRLLWNFAITACLSNQKAGFARPAALFDGLNKASMLRCKGLDGNTSVALPQKSRNWTPQTHTPQTYLTLARLTGACEHGQETKPHDFTAA
jgi:hypothetical protein